MDTRLQAGQSITIANFDSTLSPFNEVNRKAAKARGVHYRAETRCYHNDDGKAVYDGQGNPL